MAYNEFKQQSHNQLLTMMDKKLAEKFDLVADKYSLARIKSLSNNGAMSWLNVMYNFVPTRHLSNQQMYIALSLVSGLPIVTQENIKCQNCNQKMDKMGYHCLSCESKKME